MKSDLRDLPKKYSVHIPYPKIEISEKNSFYMALIKQNYAGAVSEFTAISQYSYHTYLTKNEVKETLLGISLVEMHHLSILAKVIVALGGDPNFSILKKNKELYWSGKFVPKAHSLKELLDQDLQGERDAIKQYRATANEIKDENIVAILNRIILDEEYHIKLLTELQQKLSL